MARGRDARLVDDVSVGGRDASGPPSGQLAQMTMITGTKAGIGVGDMGRLRRRIIAPRGPTTRRHRRQFTMCLPRRPWSMGRSASP
jgi:hypothetical protein